jgi:hypothetical protein
VSTLESYRTLAAGPVLGATTAFRMGAGYWGVWTTRTPNLMELGLKAWMPGPDADEAAEEFWDELVKATRDSSDAALNEFQRGIDDLDALTRAEQSSNAGTDRSSRVRSTGDPA